MHKLIVSIIATVFLIAFCKAQTTVDIVLENYKKDKDLQHASYSFCIMDAASGKVVKEYNSELALIPASTLKIVTTSAALGILGKDFTYKTDFKFSSDNSNTLVIEGKGDPSFNSSYFYDSDSVFYKPIINKLKSKKIQAINSVYVNTNYFDNKIPSSWIWGDIGNYFGAGATSLSYKDNKFSLFYNSKELNTKATLIKIKPDYFSNKITVDSDILAFGSGDEAYVYGDPNSYKRLVSGSIPPNKTNYEVEAQMPEPHEFFKYEFETVLKQNNIVINGKKNNETVPEELAKNVLTVYTHISPKLEKLVYYTNVKSDNHYAESLLNTVGAIKSGKQGNTANGIEAVTNFWKERGIDVSGLHMVDGSGLSRANTITTKIQAGILSKIYRDSSLYKPFNASLPIAGKNGSMVSLCKGTFAENNLRAKTGYINRARGYCGYVKTKSGKELAFSVLFNNYDCSAKDMKLKIEKLLIALVDL